jgi:hypothetical protein
MTNAAVIFSKAGGARGGFQVRKTAMLENSFFIRLSKQSFGIEVSGIKQ